MAMSQAATSERHDGPPALIKLFYRTGSFPRLEETVHATPAHVDIYTWPSCTLRELGHLVAAAQPDALPAPAIGTRLSFRLLYPDRERREGRDRPGARYLTRDVGSVVIGSGGRGLHLSEVQAEPARPEGEADPQPQSEDQSLAQSVVQSTAQSAVQSAAQSRGQLEDPSAAQLEDPPEDPSAVHSQSQSQVPSNIQSQPQARGQPVHSDPARAEPLPDDSDKTLRDAHFAVGDYLACAILPPDRDGSVAPPVAAAVPAHSHSHPPVSRPAGYAPRPYGRAAAAAAAAADDYGVGAGARSSLPAGDWKRGEALPDVSARRGYGMSAGPGLGRAGRGGGGARGW